MFLNFVNKYDAKLQKNVKTHKILARKFKTSQKQNNNVRGKTQPLARLNRLFVSEFSRAKGMRFLIFFFEFLKFLPISAYADVFFECNRTVNASVHYSTSTTTMLRAGSFTERDSLVIFAPLKSAGATTLARPKSL